MHPAYSVIIFTAASGAGYGLLCWVAVSGIRSAWIDRPIGLGMAAFILAFGLITIGLLSSTSHLGRPERAWRAFSQWRTSWLSREGVMALATYAVGGLFALEWVFSDASSWLLLALLAALTLIGALATLWCTGMIYASLKTIRAWNHKLVAPLYVVLGLMTGRLLLNMIVGLATGEISKGAIWVTLILLLAGWMMKTNYWSTIDNARRTHTIGEATGLGRFGTVRTLDPPHTQANFIMREMGFEVARKHATRLRQLATVALFVMPAILTLLLLISGGYAGAALAVLAVLSAAVGVGVERWLFFAEAEHVAMLYYGRQAA